MMLLKILELVCGTALAGFALYVTVTKRYRLLSQSGKKGSVRNHSDWMSWGLLALGLVSAALGGLSFFADWLAWASFGVLLFAVLLLQWFEMRKGQESDHFMEEQRAEIDRVDKKMRRLFVKRMDLVKEVGAYKAKKALPVRDLHREHKIIEEQTKRVPSHYRSYFADFLRTEIALSCDLQEKVLHGHRRQGAVRVSMAGGGYDVWVARGALDQVGEFFGVADKRALILTDSGIPSPYAEKVKAQCKEATVLTIPAGEASKSAENLQLVWKTLQENRFDRGDCLIALGGGTVGDLGGFAAGTYLRGIDFYNVPTSLLAMVDSSVGGKTAIDFGGFKNQIGMFNRPKAVLIDPDLLETLPKREKANGYAEILKVAALGDSELFLIFERGEEEDRIEEVIRRAVNYKRKVVEIDEREEGLRRVLNFGHTLGHAIEATDGTLSHGECVALGMLPVSSQEVQTRLLLLYRRLGLPTSWSGDFAKALDAATYDKKRTGDRISYVFVPHVGEYEMRRKSLEDWKKSMCRHGKNFFNTSYEG